MKSQRRSALKSADHKTYEYLDTDVDSSDDLELDDIEGEAATAYEHRRSRSLSSLSSVGSLFAWRPPVRANTKWIRLLRRCGQVSFAAFFAWMLFTPLISPSYLYRPYSYTGQNVRGEKVFIAANIVDEDLIRGAWGERIVQLVELLGEDNVFLSIYENDSGPGTKAALQELGEKVKCRKAIVSGHIDLETFPSIQILPSDHRVKRIAYLAEVRNKAIEPLTYNTTGMVFDKVLFINDVIFSARDAADLLFSTNMGPDGAARYHAACAMDFINAFKFYDTFASRDAEGHPLGVPFYPFFTNAGHGISRADVLANSDAVRVKSCWGGMVAFEAKWFLSTSAPELTNTAERDMVTAVEPALTSKNAVQFRASPELMWDASECCLIHADIAALASQQPEEWEDHDNFDTGIYMNPFIRVAYDEHSHSWLEFTRRFERLYSFSQNLVNWIARRPPFQPRRTAEAGAKVMHREWMFTGPEEDGVDRSKLLVGDVSYVASKYGKWDSVERVAVPGGFCGSRQLLVLKKQPWKAGEKIWERIEPPPGANDKAW